MSLATTGSSMGFPVMPQRARLLGLWVSGNEGWNWAPSDGWELPQGLVFRLDCRLPAAQSQKLAGRCLSSKNGASNFEMSNNGFKFKLESGSSGSVRPSPQARLPTESC